MPPVLEAQKRTYELVVSGTIASKGSTAVKTVNLFHFRRSAIVNDVIKANVITGFHDAIGTTLIAALNLGWTYDNTQVRCLDDPLDPYLLTPEGTPGAILGDRLPPHNAAFLYVKTSLRGKSFKGGKHLGPMSESDTSAATADIWNAGAIGRLQDVADAWLNGFASAEGNNWLPVHVSRKLSNFNVSPCDLVTADVVQILVNDTVGTMKHRKVKSVY